MPYYTGLLLTHGSPLSQLFISHIYIDSDYIYVYISSVPSVA